MSVAGVPVRVSPGAVAARYAALWSALADSELKPPPVQHLNWDAMLAALRPVGDAQHEPVNEAVRRMRSVSVPAELAGDPWSGDAAGTIAAELESGEPAETLPVIPPERMADFRDRWRERPGLRSLIRAAGALDEAEVARSRLVRALWEMSRSTEWQADGRGLLSDFPEFAELFGRGAGW